jgi:hypothetical protein
MRRALQRVAKKGHSSSWPGKGAKRIFAQDDLAIHAFLVGRKQDVDARGILREAALRAFARA